MNKFTRKAMFFVTASLTLLILNGCGGKTPPDKEIRENIQEINAKLYEIYNIKNVKYAVEKFQGEEAVNIKYIIEFSPKEIRVSSGSVCTTQKTYDKSQKITTETLLITMEIKKRPEETYRFNGEMVMKYHVDHWKYIGAPTYINDYTIQEATDKNKKDFNTNNDKHYKIILQFVIQGETDQQTYELTKKYIPESSSYVENFTPANIQKAKEEAKKAREKAERIKKNKDAIEEYLMKKRIVEVCKDCLGLLDKQLKENEQKKNKEGVSASKRLIELMQMDAKDWTEYAAADENKLKQAGLSDDDLANSGIKIDEMHREYFWKEKTKYKAEYKKLIPGF